MTDLELRDPADARQFMAQGLWWQRIAPPRAEQVPAILDWAIAIASEGGPLPPIGFVADVGHMIFDASTGVSLDHLPLLGWPTTLIRGYEDYALGKLLADSSFERASDAVRGYQGSDRVKGLAFLIGQMRQRAGIRGVLVSPGTLKSLRDVDPGELLREGWESIEQAGPLPLLLTMVEQLVREIRNTASVLGPEDIFELERKTAIAAFGQRVALRQVLQAATLLDKSLPRRKPRPLSRRHEVPTRIFEEDTYPVGGFASIATRGSIESLLHSQLAMMENERPDLFDIKFLRDELLYYSRDENSFLRRRRTFVFALYPDLIETRFKDAELPFQRMILLLAMLRAGVVKLTDWLDTDSLVFEIILIEPKDGPGLAAEKELLNVLLAEQVANGTATIRALPADKLAAHCAQRGRRSLCHCLLTSVTEQTLDADGIDAARFVLSGPIPGLGVDRDTMIYSAAESAWQGWTVTLERLLLHWI